MADFHQGEGHTALVKLIILVMLSEISQKYQIYTFILHNEWLGQDRWQRGEESYSALIYILFYFGKIIQVGYTQLL